MAFEVLRLSAFPDGTGGGNPAGVVLDARGLDAEAMLAVAAEVGYSETAFLVPRAEPRAYDVRYFAPSAEVPFCGHATIAAAVAVAERDGLGPLAFHCAPGRIGIDTAGGDETILATLTSVSPSVEALPADLLASVLVALGWREEELDAALPPRIAFAGARHLVLAAATRERLAALDYDFDALGALCGEHGLVTVVLVWRQDALTFHVRNPFPYGGVVEDPATGAAAAALGGYLRARGLVAPPVELTLLQGVYRGRPSRLSVGIDPGAGGVRVSGGAVAIRG
ncbi:MAG: PhzF family phenazine biosynthesis protein [Solirubrobacteraceae bacterium]